MSSGRGKQEPPRERPGEPGSPFLRAQAPLQTSGHGLIVNALQIKELTEEW